MDDGGLRSENFRADVTTSGHRSLQQRPTPLRHAVLDTCGVRIS